jgi:hypothetical protein
MKTRKLRRSGPKPGQLHREWLALVEVSGPFLSLEVLEREFPQGLDSHSPERSRRLRSAYEEWQGQRADIGYHRAWLDFVLEEILEVPREVWREGAAIPPACRASFPQHEETLLPNRVLVDDDERVRLLLVVVPPGQSLNRPLAGRSWPVDPIWRMVELLHASGNKLGIVTNGEHWAIVSAPLGEPSGVASFYTEIWLEEPSTLQAFCSLFGLRRFFECPTSRVPKSCYGRARRSSTESRARWGVRCCRRSSYS